MCMLCSNLDVLYFKVSSWKPQKYIIWILDFFSQNLILCNFEEHVFCGPNTFCTSSRIQPFIFVYIPYVSMTRPQNEVLIYLPFNARQVTKLKRDFLSSRALPIIRNEQGLSKDCHKIDHVSIIFMRIVY